MAGTGRRGRSRGELIRQRARAGFVGRRVQLSLFAENLLKDPAADAEQADFLFHVHGLGGVGKSTLLREWQEAARRVGAVTAMVDESEVHGVPQTLTELVRQLAGQAGPLKEFDRAAELYRRAQETAADSVPQDGPRASPGEVSLSSRLVAQAALGAATVLPGGGLVAAMTSPDAAAQAVDRLRAAGARALDIGGGDADVTRLNHVFVSELGRLCERHRWVVLFFDTWERTGRYLDGWLRELVLDSDGRLPPNVMVVLAGRDELVERDWAMLRGVLVDVPLEVFTPAETRTLLAARGVLEPAVVDAVLRLSMGLPLLVELLALARPRTAEDVNGDGDVVDAVVERFVRWITDARQREAVVACAVARLLNEDVFAVAMSGEERELWQWLCRQPFVSGRGEFKQYHAVVRASMMRQQRVHSPQRWTSAHLRLAEAHAAWRAEVAQGQTEAKRWADHRWLRHLVEETYHRLCAAPVAELPAALGQGAHVAGREGALPQWTDALSQAARDTGDPALLAWADRLQSAVAEEEPVCAFLTSVLVHAHLGTEDRAWAHTYRGLRHYYAGRDEEAIADLDRAIAIDRSNARAWAFRGNARLWRGPLDQALNDLKTACDIDPAYSWALTRRAEAHRRGGRFDQAITDLTASLEIAPGDVWALVCRGTIHRQTGRIEEAITDLTTAHGLDPKDAWALAQRGEAHRTAARYDQAITDFTAALALNRNLAWALGARGVAHRQAGRYDEAITDLTGALALNPNLAWARGSRGIAHCQADRYDEAVADLTAALALDPTLAWAYGSRGVAHRQAGRYDAAVADLTTTLELDPTLAWALRCRGLAHRQGRRYDEAVADFTAALALDAEDSWSLGQRGLARRQAGDFTAAREDLEPAVASHPGNLGYRFEKAMLDTLTCDLSSGPAALLPHWRGLLHAPLQTVAEDATRFFGLFRVLVLEPVADVARATEEFLSDGPNHDARTDLLHYLAELSGIGGSLALRVGECRRIVAERSDMGSEWV
ncbi:tetratricopeptide repeat protein [Streptomyces iakyrus]|uniref:Tetratricopeptide repeat protein n=2 Tax=Streptomyces iakyrus TaxID=68219 RepID=A0ABW8FFJ2_9ACTN